MATSPLWNMLLDHCCIRERSWPVEFEAEELSSRAGIAPRSVSLALSSKDMRDL